MINPFAWNEARSLHIGLNRVDDAVYRGALGDLQSPAADARAMREIADGMGFSSRLLIDEMATGENVLDALEATIERLTEGDVLLITYAGHMTSINGGVGDDADGWDEAWCLYDGILLDDTFHDLLADVPQGVDVLIVTDSCFAAGITDADGAGGGAPGGTPQTGAATGSLSSELAASATLGQFASTWALAGSVKTLIARTPNVRLGDLAIGDLVRRRLIPGGTPLRIGPRRSIGARVVSIAAAAETSLAFEAENHGLFTASLLLAIESLEGLPVSYGALMDAVIPRLPIQQPSIGVFGATGAAILDEAAFGAGAVRSARTSSRDPTFGVLTASDTPSTVRVRP